MIRVVLDTNVVISASIKPAGREALVLLLAVRQDVAMCVSAPILREYSRVLRRPKFKLNSNEVDGILSEIRRVSLMVNPARVLAVSPDERDNRFLECAEEANANYVVTGNIRHFPSRWKDIEIVPARQFLEAVYRRVSR